MAKSKSKAPKRARASKAKAKAAKARRATPVKRAKKAKAAKKRAAQPKRRAPKAKPPVRVRAKAKTKAPVTAKTKAKAKAAPTRAAVARRTAPARKPAAAAPASARAAKRLGRAPTLDRERRRATDPEMVPMPPSSLDLDRSASAARSGRADLAHKIHEHTSTGPALTAGDVDADWESADSVGDEAPGGDNPTPDQDVVDEIGRSLGVEYDDDEELQGGDEIVARDKNRWELDPASADDFDDREE